MYEEALMEAKTFFTLLDDREVAEAMNQGSEESDYPPGNARRRQKNWPRVPENCTCQRFASRDCMRTPRKRTARCCGWRRPQSSTNPL